jgi:hypothetical protein
MASDGKGQLFIGCRGGQLLVVDAATGKVKAGLPIGGHVDATVFEPASGEIFSACGEGMVSVIHQVDAGHYVKQADIPTVQGAKTLALDPKSRTLYLSCVKDGKFGVLTLGR